MDCRHVQDTILDSLIDRGALTADIDEHIAACPACAAFAVRQTAVDAGLRQALVAPELTVRLRAVVREQIRHESRPVWRDALPDVVHFASCGAATVVCLFALPFDTAAVLAVALVTTLASHAVLTAIHGSLDAAGESGI